VDARPGSVPDLKVPSRAWVPVALGTAMVSLGAGLFGPTPLGPTLALSGGSLASLLSLAALQRSPSRTTTARLAMLALVLGVAGLGVGATLTL
jgi:hypothetical protein